MGNRNDENDRDRTGPSRVNEGSRAEREINEAAESEIGHPLSAAEGGARGDILSGDLPPRDTNPERMQHTRKGQAQSPRELNHNEPPKERHPEGRG